MLFDQEEQTVEYARRFLEQNERFGNAPVYALILGHLALPRSTGRETEAQALIGKWLNSLNSPGWPLPILEQLAKAANLDDLASLAKTDDQKTEVRTYLMSFGSSRGHKESRRAATSCG